jgi:5'-3' exonuclease
MEKYMDPMSNGWQSRYYEAFLESSTSLVVSSYLQGLFWNWNYYHGITQWDWVYPFAYPPLLRDLSIPFKSEPSFHDLGSPVTPCQQLAFVLPKESLYLLDKSPPESWYPEEASFTWAFCKYFWESHVHLPPILKEDLQHFLP